MQRMFFCAGSIFSTGDAIAGAVIRYAHALAQTAESDVVELPVLRGDGSLGTATLLLTPVSQISFESMAMTRDDVRDDVLVRRLEERTRFLLEPHPPTAEATVHSSLMEYFDY